MPRARARTRPGVAALVVAATLAAGLAGAAPARAADGPREPAVAIAAMPALKGVAISPLSTLPGTPQAYGVKLGRGGLDGTVFGARGTGGSAFWVVALARPDGGKVRDLVAPGSGGAPGGVQDMLAKLALAGPIVLVSEQDGAVAVKDLPAALRQRLQSGGGVKPDATIPLRAGVNVAASALLAGAGLLEDMVKTLGILPARVPLTGRLPSGIVRTLAGESAGPPDLNEVDLALALPAIKPPGLDAVLDSTPLTVTFKGDRKGDRVQLLAGGEATVHLRKPAGGTVDVKVALGLDPAPRENEAYVRLHGPVPVDQVLPRLPLAALTVDSLELELALLKQGDKRTPQVGFHGKGKLGQSPLDLDATLGQTADRRADVTLSLGSALRLADLLGHPVPGLDGVMLERVSLGRDHVAGTVRLGAAGAGKELTALVYTPSGKSKPNLALGHPALALSDFVPPLKGSPLDDLSLSNGVLVVVPPDNDAKGLQAGSLPAPLVTMLGGPHAGALQRAGGVDLPAGVSVMASLDMSRSKPLHDLLDAVGVGTTARLPLAGRLDPELFRHTPWKGTGGAKALAQSFLDHLDLAVPLPALTLPGGTGAFTLQAGALAARGEQGKLWLGIQTGAQVKLPDRTLAVAPLKLTVATGRIELSGTVGGTSHATGDVKQLVAFPGLTVTSVGFTGWIVTATRQLTAAIEADGTLKLSRGEKAVKLKVALDSKDRNAGSVQVLTALTVNDFASAPVPGIGALALTDLTLTPTSFAGTVRFRNEDTTVVAWTPPGGTGYRFALVHDKLKLSTYVAALAGTPVGDLELDATALVYVPKGAALKAVPADQLPARLVDALGGKASDAFPLDLAEGVNVSTRAKLPASGALHDMLDGLGLKATSLPLRGVLDPAYLSVQRPTKDKAGKWPRFDVSMDLPAFHPPGAGHHVAFEKSHLGVKPNPDGSYDMALATTVAVTLDPAHVLRFTGGITRSKPGVLTFTADAKAALTAPFGIPWLTLDELEATATIDRSKKAVDLGITGHTKISGKAVTVVTKFIEDAGKLKDVVFALTGKVPLSIVPGLGGLPGIGGLTVVDPEVSRTHVSGEIDFRGAKIRAAVFADAGEWNLLFENSQFRLDQLLPGLASKHLKALTFPKLALLVSHRGFTRKASELAPPITAILADLGLKANDTVSAMAGVNIVTTMDPHTMTGPFRAALDRLGVHQPVVLAGAVGGLFGGSPSLNLEAFLPKLPAPSIGFIKLNGKADLRLLLSLTPASLTVGIGTDAQLTVGRDALVFDSSFNLVIEPPDVIVDITGKLKGDWHQPLGIKGLVLEGVFFTVGLDITGAAKLSIGGKMLIGDNEVVVEAGTSLQLEAAGVPTGLGLVGQVAHLELSDLLAVGDQLARAAGRTRHSSAGAPRDATGFKDLTVAFVTPGVVLDPSLLRGADITLPSEGVALGGTLLLGGRSVASIGGYAGPTGIKIGGSVSPFDVGPLHLYKATVDFQAAVGAKPHFLLQGHAKLHSADIALDVTVDEGGFAFSTTDKFGDGVEVELTARSTNGVSLRNNDFAVHAVLKADIGRHLLDALKRALEELFADLESRDRSLKAQLATANAAVGDREKALAAAKAEVQRERKQLVHDVDAIRKKLADLDRQLKSLPGDIDHALRDARAAVRNFRFARAAELRAEAGVWQVELASAQVAYRATDTLLRAVESGVADLPLEADPRVLGDLVALEAARANAAVLGLEVRVLDLVVADLRAAANRLSDTSIVDIHRISLDGTFGTQLTFTVDAKILGKYDVQAVGAFSPKDAASKAAGLVAAAKDLASHLLAHKRNEHEQAAAPAAQPGASAGAAAPGAPGAGAPARPVPAAAAAAGGVDVGKDALLAVGAGDMEGVVYEIKKDR